MQVLASFNRKLKLTIMFLQKIRKQTDIICLEQVRPGTPYKADNMEDVNCLYEEDELEKGALVQISLFPTILRRGFETDGSLWREPCLLMKAKVMTIFPNK